MFIHGAIHLLGVLKLIAPSRIPGNFPDISRIQSVFWFLAAILIMGSAILFFLKIQYWFLPVTLGLIISQVLIIMNWQDAKFGTIINLISLAMAIAAFGEYHFNKEVQKETRNLLQNIPDHDPDTISERSMNNLPPIVQKWLKWSGVKEKPLINSIRITQKGRLKMKPDAGWMPFKATQYVNVANTSFLWKAKVHTYPFVDLYARDKLSETRGSMLIKVAGILPVVDEKDNMKINSGSMIRYLGEICWIPFAALNDNISWESIDDYQAKATLKVNESSVSGIFNFSKDGELLSFEAERYFGAGLKAEKERWVVETMSYKEFNAYKIPDKSKVTWKLKEGDFTWLELEIMDIQYGVDPLSN